MPTNKELSSLAEVLARRFVQRWDMYPKQLRDGRYIAVHKPLRKSLLLGHLRGEVTLGTYVLDPESRGRFLVLDADDEPDWRRLKALAGTLLELETPSYLERSRRGGHLWLFLAAPIPGTRLRAFGNGVTDYFGLEGIELFPKQEQLGDGPGSNIRLPFGVHMKTGKRYGFYTVEGEPLAARLREQIRLLDAPGTVPEAVLERFEAHGAALEEEKRRRRWFARHWEAWATEGEEASLPERIKAAIPVHTFVLRYVELSPAGRGLCPFHDDHVESFSVNIKQNYWHCFAGCGGGNIINFWMLYNQCDFKTALSELAAMLLVPEDEEEAEEE